MTHSQRLYRLPYWQSQSGSQRTIMSYVVIAFLLAALVGLDGHWPFVAVLGAAFLIYLLH